jgi:hypothetical protein
MLHSYSPSSKPKESLREYMTRFDKERLLVEGHNNLMELVGIWPYNKFMKYLALSLQ